jgi:tetratricopeptide (TPR) repeat protein
MGSVLLLFFLFYKTSYSFMLAALFAVHPILIESVTWISGGPYAMGGFFLLLSFMLWTRERYGWSWMAFMVATLFCNSKSVVFPLILFISCLCVKLNKRMVLWLVVFFSSAFAYSAYLLRLIPGRLNILSTVYYTNPKVANPLIQIPIAITSYIELLIWPDKLTFYHTEMTFVYQEFWARIVVFLILVIMAIWSFKNDKAIFFWMSWFFIALIPTLTPLGISWVVAERYIYFASVGFFVLLTMLLKKMGKYGIFLFLILMVCFGTRTWFRNKDWRNEYTFWRATDKVSPSSSQNHNNLGDVYSRLKKWPLAEKEFRRAVEIKPRFADAWNNLGWVLLQEKKIEQAQEAFNIALKINPNIWQAKKGLRRCNASSYAR